MSLLYENSKQLKFILEYVLNIWISNVQQPATNLITSLNEYKTIYKINQDANEETFLLEMPQGSDYVIQTQIRFPSLTSIMYLQEQWSGGCAVKTGLDVQLYITEVEVQNPSPATTLDSPHGECAQGRSTK